MVFNSLRYFIFFPIVLLLFYAVPRRMKNVWLLIASYVFYWLWNAKYCFLLLVCTIITYSAALAICSCRQELSYTNEAGSNEYNKQNKLGANRGGIVIS